MPSQRKKSAVGARNTVPKCAMSSCKSHVNPSCAPQPATLEPEWASLPDAALHRVFEGLLVFETANCALVCKMWYNLIDKHDECFFGQEVTCRDFPFQEIEESLQDESSDEDDESDEDGQAHPRFFNPADPGPEGYTNNFKQMFPSQKILARHFSHALIQVSDLTVRSAYLDKSLKRRKLYMGFMLAAARDMEPWLQAANQELEAAFPLISSAATTILSLYFTILARALLGRFLASQGMDSQAVRQFLGDRRLLQKLQQADDALEVLRRWSHPRSRYNLYPVVALGLYSMFLEEYHVALYKLAVRMTRFTQQFSALKKNLQSQYWQLGVWDVADAIDPTLMACKQGRCGGYTKPVSGAPSSVWLQVHVWAFLKELLVLYCLWLRTLVMGADARVRLQKDVLGERSQQGPGVRTGCEVKAQRWTGMVKKVLRWVAPAV